MSADEKKVFAQIKERLKALKVDYGDQIKKNNFVRMATVVIAEMDWLSRQLDKALGNEVADEKAAELVEA